MVVAKADGRRATQSFLGPVAEFDLYSLPPPPPFPLPERPWMIASYRGEQCGVAGRQRGEGRALHLFIHVHKVTCSYTDTLLTNTNTRQGFLYVLTLNRQCYTFKNKSQLNLVPMVFCASATEV